MTQNTILTLAEAVAALRAFVKALTKRRDVVLEQNFLGRPAPARLLAHYRQHPELLPAELLDLYALLNGADVEWSFIGCDGGGALHIPPLDSGYQTFEPDATYANDFGPGKLSLFFDQQAAEWATWLVAEGPAAIPAARLLFADQGEGDAGTLVADSIAEYLTKAVAHGLAWHWPVPTPDVLGVAARIAAPAAPRAKIRPGMRVHLQLFAEGGRAEVRALHTITDPAVRARYPYALRPTPQLALVRLDLGPLLWIPLRHLKPVPPPPDAYERLRADPRQLLRLAETEGWRAAKRLFLLVCDPDNQSDGRPVAALLRPLPLAEAVALVQALTLGFYSVADSPHRPLMLTLAEQAQVLNRSAWRRYEWAAPYEVVFSHLLEGLALRLRLEPPQPDNPALAAALVALERALVPRYHNLNLAVYLEQLRQPRWQITAATYGSPKPGFPTDHPIAQV